MGFDEQAERAIVWIAKAPDQVGGQRSGGMKEGITRAQLARFYKRLNARGLAQSYRYADGQTAAQLVESWADKGAALVFRGLRYYLVLGGVEVRLDSVFAYEYAKVVLGWPGSERIY